VAPVLCNVRSFVITQFEYVQAPSLSGRGGDDEMDTSDGGVMMNMGSGYPAGYTQDQVEGS